MRADIIAKNRRGNLFRVVYIGTCFMFILTACNAAQNIMSEIFERLGYDNLTQICFITQCIMFIAASFLSSYYVNKVPKKFLMVLGAVAYGVFISGGAIVTYCDKFKDKGLYCQPTFIYSYNITAAMLLGFVSPFFWICQGVYVNKCCDEHTRGMSNGIALSLMQSSQLWSAIVTTTMLGYTDEFTFYIVVLLIDLVAIIMAFFILKPLEYPGSIENQQKDIDEGLRKSVKALVTKTLFNKRYAFLFSGMVFSGIVMGFFPNYLGTAISYTIKSLPSNIVEEKIGFVFFILAVGEILAGLVIGKLSNKYDKINLLYFALIMGQVALTVTFLSDFLVEYNVSVLSGFLWGFCDNSTQTIICIIIGSKFDSSPQLFAIYGMLQFFGVLSISSLKMALSKINPIYFIGIVAAIVLVFQCLMHYSLPKKIRPKEEREGKDSFLTTKSTEELLA